MPNNTRKNTNQKREAERFEKALGIAGEVGYKNTSRVAKRLSKRSANNHLTRWRQKTNSAFVKESKRTARQRLANLEAQIHVIQEPLPDLQEELANVERQYNPRRNPPHITAQQEVRMERLRRNMNVIETRVSPLLTRQAYLQMLLNDPNGIQAEPVLVSPNQFRNRVNQLLREAREEHEPVPRPRTFANVARPAAAGAPQPLTLANMLRLFGPNA
jgi:hypothetical protein